MSNYPEGAKNDPRAPYNEVLNKEESFNISVVCDIDKSVFIPEDITDYSQIEDNLKRDVISLLEDLDFIVSEIIINHE